MRLTDPQIDRIADTLLNALLSEGGARLKEPRGKVLERIGAVIRDNLEAERTIDREARTLLEAHLKSTGGDVDEHMLLTMIKKKLAEEKDFPL